MQSSTSPSEKRITASEWIVVVILSSVATMVMYAETMLVPAIPSLIKDFNISYSTSSWILTTYLLSGAIMTPIAGKLSDIYGKKKILLIIMIFYTAGVSIAGFSTNIDFMLIARGLQGIGMSMFPIAFSIVRAQFPREKIAIGQGIITSMYAGGAVIGLSIGGTIIQNYGWHSTFFTIIPITIVLLFIIWRFIHTDKGKGEGEVEDRIGQTKKQQQQQQQKQIQQQQEIKSTERKNNSESIKRKSAIIKSNSRSATSNKTIDIKGAITLAVTITSFLLLLSYLDTGSGGSNISSNNSHGSSSTIQIASFLVLGIISLMLFILIEKKSSSPLVDFSMMTDKRPLPVNIIIMIVGFSMFMVLQTIPIFVKNPLPVGFGENTINATKVPLPFALVLLVFGPTSGLIISKLGSMKSIIIGTVVLAAGLFGLTIFHSTELFLSVNLAILSIGLSLSNVGAQNVIILSTPRQNSGISLGITSLLRIVGSSISPVVAAMFMQGYQHMINIGGGKSQSFPSSESYSLIFLTAAILSIMSISLEVVLLRTKIPKCQNHLPEGKRYEFNNNSKYTSKDPFMARCYIKSISLWWC